MQIETITLRRAVDNAFLQEPITEAEFETFRQQLVRLLGHADTANKKGESEEHLKNLIKPFFSNTNFGDEHYINTKDRQDLAIHNGKTSNSSVGVIIEAKRPSNKEMITGDDLNRKAFHEAILYYLRERIENKNEDIKHLIITDVYSWYIFDAQDFERHFYESKKLKSWYNEWKQGQKVSSRTKFVYKHLSEFVEELDGSIKAAQVSIDDYRQLLKKEELSRDEQKKLVPLFKLFTPIHLLKLPFASDSNSLNKSFYRELLYILGLKEYKEKGTHYITRLDEENRQHASLIENTITQLESLNVLSRLPNRREFGKNEQEQLFNVAIQLLITWINRILFLKLLEAQLFKYHREDERFQFLSHREIKEYDGLNKLFFQVLAVPFENRSERINKHFGHIPYLNSSLFDVAEIEQHALRISELEDGLEIEVHNRSKIRNRDGERLKGETLSALEYLLRFLDAYNFNTEGTAEVQKEAKTLINASVLGRIFEKINGYKDGSFFTPGYITEYMCRETIRRSVVQKFNETYENWNCETIDDVTGKISRYEVPYRKANEIVNSITICDPAVGSGHFLVSALNELIAIKSDLRIFMDEDDQRIRDVEISVDNDELSIAVGQDPFFEYRVFSEWKNDGRIERTVGHDTQRLQKALFREKNILIENCLFGVDINPNSVNICRLRLWIELLKHTYYKKETGYQSLEVLPNIDINIKQGNSLVSRFGLDADLSSVFKDSEHSVDDYKQAVKNYKNTKDRTEKQRLQQYIHDIKEEFTVSLSNLRPINKDLSKARGKLEMMQNADLFGEKKFSKKDIKKQKKEVEQLEEQKAEEESGVIYNQAFEWRFEFPEILDEDGSYAGFDVIVANPPYISLEDTPKQTREYYRSEFNSVERKFETSVLFFLQGFQIGKNQAELIFISPITWETGSNYKKLRKQFFTYYNIKKIINLPFDVFEDAYVETGIFHFQNKKEEDNGYEIYIYKKKAKIDSLEEIDFNEIDSSLISPRNYKIIFNPTVARILSRTEGEGFVKLGDITISTQGLSGSRFDRTDRKDNPNDYPYLEDGQAYNYQLITNEITYTSLEDKENLKRFYEAEPKLMIRRIVNRSNRLDIGYTEDKLVFKKDINPFVIKDSRFDPKYVLGVMASKFISYLYINTSSIATKDDFRQTTLTELRKLPIPVANKTIQKNIAEKADYILTAKEDDPDADTSELEGKIDQLVYELYGLSEGEIEIVEGSVR